MVLILTGCSLLPTREIEVEVPRNVYIEKEVPVFIPDSLLVSCEPDPQLAGDKITNEKIAIQSLERKARGDRCSERVENIKIYNDTMKENYDNGTPIPD